MPIQVTCAKCLTRFSVNEKFAGKKGPCPKCKAEIVIPTLAEQVVIHAPPDAAPKDSTGKSVLKPIKRQETQFSTRGIAIAAGIVFMAIVLALGMRMTGGTPLIARVVVALAVAPPLAWVGYSITRDTELEPYMGTELWGRVGAIAGVLAALWMVYVWAFPYMLDLDYASEMTLMQSGIALLIMIVLGSISAMIAFEQEFVGGLTIAGIYFAATLLLAILGGVPLVTT